MFTCDPEEYNRSELDAALLVGCGHAFKSLVVCVHQRDAGCARAVGSPASRRPRSLVPCRVGGLTYSAGCGRLATRQPLAIAAAPSSCRSSSSARGPGRLRLGPGRSRAPLRLGSRACAHAPQIHWLASTAWNCTSSGQSRTCAVIDELVSDTLSIPSLSLSCAGAASAPTVSVLLSSPVCSRSAAWHHCGNTTRPTHHSHHTRARRNTKRWLGLLPSCRLCSRGSVVFSKMCTKAEASPQALCRRQCKCSVCM